MFGSYAKISDKVLELSKDKLVFGAGSLPILSTKEEQPKK